MAIKFKTIQRGRPGVVGGGEKKYYASANVTGEVSIEGLTKRIEKISTVSGADIRAVLYALVDVSVGEMSDGKVVRLGDLGYFRVSISSEGVDSEKEVTSDIIKGGRVIFTPGKEIKNMLKNLTYQKM